LGEKGSKLGLKKGVNLGKKGSKFGRAKGGKLGLKKGVKKIISFL
jgi:hypothetical protein